jgi:hypothetical protein
LATAANPAGTKPSVQAVAAAAAGARTASAAGALSTTAPTAPGKLVGAAVARLTLARAATPAGTASGGAATRRAGIITAVDCPAAPATGHNDAVGQSVTALPDVGRTAASAVAVASAAITAHVAAPAVEAIMAAVTTDEDPQAFCRGHRYRNRHHAPRAA